MKSAKRNKSAEEDERRQSLFQKRRKVTNHGKGSQHSPSAENSLSHQHKQAHGHGDVVYHISKFLSLTSAKSAAAKSSSACSGSDTSSNVNANNQEDTSSIRNEKTFDSVLFLVRHLEKMNSDTTAKEQPPSTSMSLTREDIASLLLPWSVARLMRSSSASDATPNAIYDEKMTNTVWRTLSSCLSVLCTPSPLVDKLYQQSMITPKSSAHETIVSNSFPQSTLSRLIPLAASVAFSMDDHVDTSEDRLQLQKHASLCFHHLVQRYRPSFEIACTSLLRHIEQLVFDSTIGKYPPQSMKHTLPGHHYSIVCGVLRMIHSLLGQANPKRSFGVLCSKEVLPRLGRLAFVRCNNHDIAIDANHVEKEGGGAEYLVERIVCDGLFHSVHHMDGFRSMVELRVMPAVPQLDSHGGEKVDDETQEEQQIKGGGGKGCYQSSLFQSLRTLISGVQNDGGFAHADSDRDAMATVNVLPLLTRGFFDRMQNGSGGSQGKTTTEEDSKLQFRLWCHVASPAFERLFSMCNHDSDGGILEVAILKMAAETLKIILNCDAYSPSYSDLDGALVSYLKFVTEGLLRCIDRGDAKSPLHEQKTTYLISSIRCILLLNHRLLHERLSQCIAFACVSLQLYCREETPQTDASSLLSTVIKTYGDLRQVGHFLSSCQIACRSNHNAESMHFLLSNTQATKLLASTYQSCPSGQVHEIWDFFDGWVVSIIDKVSLKSNTRIEDETHDKPEAASELIFAIRMFIMFIKNIRTDKHNSPELRHLCELSMTSSVEKLLSESNNRMSQTSLYQLKGRSGLWIRQGIDLCGWLVDLHARSSFWIDSITIDRDGSSFLMAQKKNDKTLNIVLAHLCDAATHTVQSENFKAWKAWWTRNKHCEHSPVSHNLDMPLSLCSSVLHLAMHRVHQLHSMIYYCKIQEDEDGDCVKDPFKLSSMELTSEAKLLVNFAIYKASSQTPEESIDFESLWPTLAQSINTWSNYAEPFHSKVFLNWFFSALCASYDTVAPDLEKVCVLTLIRDTSFYEVKDCVSILMQVGGIFALSKVLRFIEHSSPNYLSARVREVTSYESAGVADSCLELTWKIEEGGANFPLIDSAEETFKTVATIVAFLASAPLELYLCKENIYLIDRFIGLDILISFICENMTARAEGKCTPTLIKILCTNRFTLSSLIPRTLLTSSQTFAPLLKLVTNHMISSSDTFHSYPEVSWATGNVMSELFSLCVDYHEKDNHLLIYFCERISDVILMDYRTTSPSEFTARAYLIRSVIRRMNILHRRDSFSRKDATAIKVYQVVTDMTRLCLKHLWSQIIDRFNDRETEPHSSMAAAASLLLASEILSFLGNVLPATNSSLMSSKTVDEIKGNFKQMFDLISSAVDSSHCADFTAAVHYFLASVLIVDIFRHGVIPPDAVLERLLRTLEIECLTKQEGAPLLEAALCSLIREAKLDDIKFIVSYVSWSDGGERQDPAFIVRIYYLLINCVKTPEQIKLLSAKSTSFLSTSINLLRQLRFQQSYERVVSNTGLFTAMMSSLIPRKEILLLSGREIAIICCEMSSLFSKKSRRNDVSLEEVNLFKSACLLVSSLVTHYPKQLYGCPSPLFGLLLAMLNDIFECTSGLPSKALEYAKICELLIPHKEVFKKHSLGLILKYIHALKSGMTPTTKSRLMPSVYGLLDMCSDFEIRQINAMIDIPSKTLFSPVFKSYQKYYQYHGQA